MLLFFVSSIAFSAKLGTLNDVLKPEMIRVSENQFFVVQGAKIFNYSLPDLKLIRTIGKRGEGPGELITSPLWFNTVTVRPGSLFVDGFKKVIYFSRDGKLIKETRKAVARRQVFPIGKNFIVLNQTYKEENIQYQVMDLYDSSFQKIKELCRQESSIQTPKKMTDLPADSMDFSIWDDKIFVEKSPMGFVIDVYDGNGNKLYQIKKEIGKTPFTAKHKEDAIRTFKEDAFVKEMGFENFKRTFSDLRFLDFFPVIQSIDVSNNRIFIRTFKRKNGKEECIVMDLKGKVLKQKYLSRVENAPFLAHFLGIRYYTIHDNKFYYLSENEDEETWELFAEEI
ncbi:MAG: hypothetical protein GY950_33590 [bacterium]|nr:hypothetical protein [bacterium]